MANDQIIRDLEDMHVLASAHARVSEAAVRGVWAAVDRLRAENERLGGIVDKFMAACISFAEEDGTSSSSWSLSALREAAEAAKENADG